jgi:hypothetical protein
MTKCLGARNSFLRPIVEHERLSADEEKERGKLARWAGLKRYEVSAHQCTGKRSSSGWGCYDSLSTLDICAFDYSVIIGYLGMDQLMIAMVIMVIM